MSGHISMSLASLTVVTLLTAGCGRSHGTDGEEDAAAVDAGTPDMSEPDMFDLTIALGCGWETVELAPGVSLRGIHGRATFGELHPVWFVGGEGLAIGWQESTPLQTVGTEEGALLSSAWHDQADALWATELPGAMLRLRDGAWERFESGVDQALLAVDGTAPDSAWAVGMNGAMAEWDGEGWTALPSLVPHHLSAVVALTPDDVWAVGSTDDGGVVLHFDGEEWSAQEVDARLHDVSAVAPDDVWAVGSAVLHWDGSRWAEEEVGAPGEWGSVVATEGRVWIAGVADRVMMQRFDGSWIDALEDAGFLWDMWQHPDTGNLWVAGEGAAHRCVRFVL